MKKNETEKGRISNRFQPVGNVTWEMVRDRAWEIAVINGRGPHNILDSDFDQARRELTTLEGEAPKDEVLESVPESERWDPVPGSPGKQYPRQPLEDEEPENERMVQEGVEDAEHDQMVQGTREQNRKEREG